MANKRRMISKQLVLHVIDKAITARQTYDTIREMANREGLPEDVRNILRSQESLAFAECNKKERWVTNKITEAMIPNVSEAIRHFVTNPDLFPLDPKWKMVDGKIVETSVIETEDEEEETESVE